LRPVPPAPGTLYSPAVERAIRAAVAAHEGQFRKGAEQVPYATHPLHVALLLARAGADDEVLQAGLLHDVVEDVEGWDLGRVEREFGLRVRGIVAELTEDKTRSWAERKEHGITSAAGLSPEAALVKACDKLHNLRSLGDELASTSEPAALWKRFNGGRERTLAMSERLVRALAPRVPGWVAAELEQALRRLQG